MAILATEAARPDRTEDMTVLEELKELTKGRTHWEGCEEIHPLCLAMKEIERLQPYYDAIDDEAITTFTLRNEFNAREQLHSIINWHIEVATDPKVNGGYKLVKQ